MKRLFITSLFAIIMIVGVLPSYQNVGAVDIGKGVCDNPTATPDICGDINATKDPDTGTNPLYGPEGIITRAANGLSLAAGVIAILMIVVAGIRMTLSSGDAGKVKSTRDQIIYACVGLVVAIIAQAIVRFVLNRIGA